MPTAHADGAEPRSVESLIAAVQRLRGEIGKRVVGQEAVVDEILMALVAGGPAPLVGVPGLAETLMLKSPSALMQPAFRRIKVPPAPLPRRHPAPQPAHTFPLLHFSVRRSIHVCIPRRQLPARSVGSRGHHRCLA